MPQHLQDIVISTVVAAVVGWSLARWRDVRRSHKEKRRVLDRTLLAQLQAVHQLRASADARQSSIEAASVGDVLLQREKPASSRPRID
ncbi:MAG TPA: hypothetical protein VGM82_24385 [Gemmatimonadaceae bacterium]|jgi:hypothetical protein